MWTVLLPTILFVFAFTSWKYSVTAETKYAEDHLILTNFINNGNADLARSLSRVDPSNFLGLKSHSGFLTVNEEFGSNLFFWFFPNQAANLEETPLIIWLQGGPGYSSLKGLFDIIGPLQVKDGKVQARKVTWASNYSLLFVDNPVGAGFSFTKDTKGIPDNEDDVGDQLYEFLQQFLDLFPELRTAPLFISGESYAGKYVPALAIKIHRRRRSQKPINLKGLTIGNGLIDPRTMMHYSELCKVLGLLDENEVYVVKGLQEKVVKYIDQKKMIAAGNAFNKTIEYIKSHSGVSIYNFNDDASSLGTELEEFLNRADVRKWIHAGNVQFDLNNQDVYNRMLPDAMNSTKPWVEELLEHYGVMGYSGQLDVILPFSLSKRTYASFKWSRSSEYKYATRRKLYLHDGGKVIGYIKSGGNFVEALIRRAGHMVPVEQPEVAKYLIDLFIQEYRWNVTSSSHSLSHPSHA